MQAHSTQPETDLMNAPAQFIVLIERRIINHRFLAVLFGMLLLFAAAIGVRPAFGQTASSKIASDLQAVISAPTTPLLNWAKDVNGIRYVKVLVISNSTDPDLVALRADVLAKGGSVYYRYTSVRGLLALLPANQVAAVAARSDVIGVSSNRMTLRTASVLEAATGATTTAVRTYSSASAYTGLDGTGIGIAVLDSGVMSAHKNMSNGAGISRVKRAIQFNRVGDANAVGATDWTPGLDVSAGLYPGSTTMSGYESNIANESAPRPDHYGHGTMVASIAAGRGFWQTTDSTGIAPNANIYDVKEPTVSAR